MEAPIMQKIEYIEPKEIEKAQERLRSKYQGTSVIGASLFNLVIYAKKDNREDYLQQIAKIVVNKFPCRIIFITEFPEGKEDFFRTYVSEIEPSKGNSVFCELINFDVSGPKSKERLPFVVLPHLLSDLPVYLLWGDDPAKNDPISLNLEHFATRTIFDSESAIHLCLYAKTLLDLYEKTNSDIGDLNWARSEAWRALFSHAFNSDEKFRVLARAKELKITYNAIESINFSHHKIQAAYFQAWIASRLKWNYEGALISSPSEVCFKYHSNTGSILVRLSPGKYTNLPPGRILSADLISYDNEHMIFERDRQNPENVKILHTTSLHCEMPVHYLLDKEVSGRSVISEIYSQGTKESFLEVLQLITKVPEGIVCS